MTELVATPLQWPDEVDEILSGDLVVTVGSPTPAGGVVLNSVTPLGLRDRELGTVTFTTSLGFGKKLERIAADPRIAVAYHTRQHGHCTRPGLVVVQGTASVRADFSDQEREEVREQAADHVGQLADGRFWDWWLKVYYQDRVGVDVQASRILWWPDGNTRDEPEVLGQPLPSGEPPAKKLPKGPSTPRVAVDKVHKAARSKDHRLLGVLLADGMPLVLPVPVNGSNGNGLLLDVPPLVPRGSRRAGFIAHSFRPKLVGLSTATHTGWLDADEAGAVWTPHTRRAFTAPPNKTLLLLGNGGAARWGYRQAIKQGRGEIVKYANQRPER